MSDKFRVVLTPEEREATFGTVAITFDFDERRGLVIVGEEWASMDETWSSGISVKIPTRVWAEGLAWLAKHLT